MGSLANPVTVIWFSPDSIGLNHLQALFTSYAWTSTLESLYEHHTQLTTSPVVLFDLDAFQEHTLEHIQAISTILPHIPLIAVGSNQSGAFAEIALANGATDYYLGFLGSPLLKHRVNLLSSKNPRYSANADTLPINHEGKAHHPQAMELAFMAFYDELTGLPNRKLFFSRLEEAIKIDITSNKCVPLLYIDLDGFKEINDTHTHKVGDWLLQKASIRLRHCVKRTDTVARIGGDEFSIILSDITDPADITSVVIRILYNLSAPFFYNNLEIKISASIGIATFPQNACTSHELFNQADRAMYTAKQIAPGNYHYYSSDDKLIATTNTLKAS